MTTVDAVIAGLFAVGGIRSLVHWLRRPFEPSGPQERFLYVMHLTGRIGWWFGLAAFFLAYAILDEPQSAGWFILVPIALAGLQLLTGFLLSRGPDDGQAPAGQRTGAAASNGEGASQDGAAIDVNGHERRSEGA